MTFQEKIIDLTTGEEIFRDYTPQEMSEAAALQAKVSERFEENQKLIDAKLSVLQKLGITEDEAKLLLS